MVVLYICKLYSIKGNGVIGALQTEIEGLKKYCDVAIFNYGMCFNFDNFEYIYDSSDYKKIDELPVPFNTPNLIVFEEIYKWEYIKLSKTIKKMGIPYIIIPHGSLVQKEQHKKFLKKKIANLLFFNSFIFNAKAIQFLNEQEKNNSHFRINDFTIIPNSVYFQKLNNNLHRKGKTQCNSFIYIGRYSIYTKGLDLLIKTCNKYKSEFMNKNIHFDLYGRIDDNSYNDYNVLNREILKKDLTDMVTLHDAVYDSEKYNVMRNSDFFIQLSRHEGQPMGIIEALSLGLPCIVTYATSFGDYCEKNKCGIVVEENIDSIYVGILKMVNLDKKNINILSNNARKKSVLDFSVDVIGKKTFLLYSQIISRE